MTDHDMDRWRGDLHGYLAWAADPHNWQNSPLFCARHWAPCPVDGKPGLLLSILLTVEVATARMPKDVGGPTGMNSWLANLVTPICCELGDETMAWLWAETDRPHCGCPDTFEPYQQPDDRPRYVLVDEDDLVHVLDALYGHRPHTEELRHRLQRALATSRNGGSR